MDLATDLTAGAELADAISATGEAFVFLTVNQKGIVVSASGEGGEMRWQYATWERLAQSKAPITPRLVQQAVEKLSEPLKGI